MSFDRLNSLDLEALQSRLNKYGPKLVAAGFPVLKAPQVAVFIRAYLYKYENLYTKVSANAIKEFHINKSIITESKVHKYKWLAKSKNISNEELKAMISELNVPQEYISVSSLETSFYEYLYKSGSKVPRSFWFGYQVLFSPKDVYDVSEENWQDITPYPITKDELMQIISRSYNSYSARDLLAYQSFDNIISFLQSYHESNPKEMQSWQLIIQDIPEEDFMTKKFIINYLTSDDKIIPELFLLEFFTTIHDPTGRRRELIERYLGNGYPIGIFRSPIKTKRFIAAYPPYWFEEQWLIEGAPKLSSVDSDRLIENLIQESVTDVSFDKLESLLYIPAEPVQNRLPTHYELGEMISQKDPYLKLFSKDVILRSAGFKGAARYENDWTCNNLKLIEEIKQGFGRERFEIYTKFDMCKAEPGVHPVDNIYMEEYTDFLIAYGSYFNLNCMSIDDLIASFVTREINGVATEISFRRPYDAGLFTGDQVQELQTLLLGQPPNFSRGFAEKREKLIGIISLGLKNTLTVERAAEFLREYVKQGTDENKKNIEIFRKMMVHLFNAGMYQRTWKGPGNPYPHTMHEADVHLLNVSSQECIDVTMGPELSAFLEEFNNLEPVMMNFVKAFPAIYKVETRPYQVTPYSQAMVSMIEQVIGLRDDSGKLLEKPSLEGNMCVGGVSKLMIYSAYVYLQLLGFNIEGFDIERFYPESGHRLR